MKKRVYLAGPGVFLPDPFAEGERLKALCRDFGFEGIYPLDSNIDIASMEKRQAARAIYQANIDFIRAADAVIADMRPFRGPGMDGGTAFEMGFAVALGKPVVGYGAQGSYIDRCRALYGGLRNAGPVEVDPDGLTVEDFDYPDNLMMACCAVTLADDERAALAHLATLFRLS